MQPTIWNYTQIGNDAQDYTKYTVKSLIYVAPYLAIVLLITQMKLEHRLSAPLQLHLHSRLNTGLQ